jgi:hypothetical protein
VYVGLLLATMHTSKEMPPLSHDNPIQPSTHVLASSATPSSVPCILSSVSGFPPFSSYPPFQTHTLIYQKNTTDIECLVLNFLFWRWSFLNSDAPVSVIYFSVGPLIVPMHQNYVYFNLTHPSDRCYRLDTPDKTLISLPGWPQAHASKLPFQFAWILQCMAHSSFR